MFVKKYFFGVLFKRLFVLLLLLFGSAHYLFAQHNTVGYLEFDGKCEKLQKPLSGAIVTLYKNSVKQTQLTTGRNGKFKFFLDFGANYKITFSSEGCVDMSLLVLENIPKEKENIFPVYEIEVTFFDNDNKDVNLPKFKNPFTKIIFDGKKMFLDDPDYLKQFEDGLFIDHKAEAKALAEKQAKEKATQDKLAAQKAAEEKAKLAAQQLAQQQRAQNDADSLAKLKAAEVADTKASDKSSSTESMETDAIKLEKEKEAKAEMAKKNTGIRTKYENDLLKAVAENERIEKEKKYQKMKADAESNSVIEKLRREAELKAKTADLRAQETKNEKTTIINEQVQEQNIKDLVQAAAFARRSININQQKEVPDISHYKMVEAPSVAVMNIPGFLKNVKTITVTLGNKIIIYRRESYVWGSEYYYKNKDEINKETYIQETLKYTPSW